MIPIYVFIYIYKIQFLCCVLRSFISSCIWFLFCSVLFTVVYIIVRSILFMPFNFAHILFYSDNYYIQEKKEATKKRKGKKKLENRFFFLEKYCFYIYIYCTVCYVCILCLYVVHLANEKQKPYPHKLKCIYVSPHWSVVSCNFRIICIHENVIASSSTLYLAMCI